jgi:hypothetical protein
LPAHSSPEYQRKYMRDYRFEKKAKASLKNMLDLLGRILMEEYLKELVAKSQTLQKIKASHPDKPEIHTAFDSLVLRLVDMMHE